MIKTQEDWIMEVGEEESIEELKLLKHGGMKTNVELDDFIWRAGHCYSYPGHAWGGENNEEGPGKDRWRILRSWRLEDGEKEQWRVKLGGELSRGQSSVAAVSLRNYKRV